MSEIMYLGTWSPQKLDELLREADNIKDLCERIAFISMQFLGTPYKESTLIGNTKTPETLVVNFESFDCFTFLDSIEAMRLSRSFTDFQKNLVQIRYKAGMVGYEKRNHFFTDWRESNRDFVQDVTAQIGGTKTKTVNKTLNHKDDGSCFLTGIAPFDRIIVYIPPEDVNETVLAGLKTGDYVGIYSELQGLDVSHVGIIIKNLSGPAFRHASSAPLIRKVVDQDFLEYISDKPGIIILRPCSNSTKRTCTA
jgi:hypothetical protein